MSVYPRKADWGAYTESVSPSVLLRSGNRAYMRGLLSSVGEEDTRQADLVAAILDIDAMTGAALDKEGDRINLPRRGLDDRWYARLLRGAKAAGYSDTGFSDTWSVWLAATGVDPSDARLFGWPIPGSALVYSDAIFPSIPPEAYVNALGDVLLRATPPGCQWTAELGVSSTGVWGAPSWGTVTWSTTVTAG